jgi:predicted alpha/beta-hydrolase family hydrolase
MSRSWGLLLAPGASAGRDQPALVAIDRAASGAGLRVERIDFPYRLAGRKAPDRAPVLVGAINDAARALADHVDQVIVGGRSMGGRMASIAVAEGLPAAGLVLISYPLHPPGRPDRLRSEHFPELSVPCLFVSGTRDSFGTPAELQAAAAAISGPVTFEWVEGGDHGLRRSDDAVAASVMGWLGSLGIAAA